MISFKANSNLKLFLRYITQNVLGMIGLSCYILADTFFIANGLGTRGLAALNLAIPIYSFVNGCGLMLGIGGAAKYSIFKGQADKKNSEKVFPNTIYLAVMFSVFFMLTGLIFSRNITSLLKADAEIFEMVNIYLKMILLFAPCFIMNDVLLCFVRNDGSPGLSMTAMLLGSLSNIILDYIFIFPLHMGIFGAVLATGFAPLISMCILSRHWFTGKNQFHMKWIHFSPRLAVQALSLGFPSLITEAASGIVIIIFNTIILGLEGNTGVAAYGVIANLSLVVTSVYTGIAQGMQPLTSRAYGHNNTNEMKQFLRYAFSISLLLSFPVYLSIFLFAAPITGLFNSEQNLPLQQTAVTGLRLYFTAVPFAGINIILSMYFSSAEKALPAQTISLLRGLFLIIPAAFLLSYFAGMTGVWLSYPVIEGLVALLGIIMLCTSRPRILPH